MWDCRAGARAESWWMSDGGFLRFSVFNNFLYLKKFLFKFSVRNVHVLFSEVSLTHVNWIVKLAQLYVFFLLCFNSFFPFVFIFHHFLNQLVFSSHFSFGVFYTVFYGLQE